MFRRNWHVGEAHKFADCCRADNEDLPSLTIKRITGHRNVNSGLQKKTLAFIQERNVARAQGNVVIQRDLCKRIKNSVKADRSAWFDDLLQSGDWDHIRKMKKKSSHSTAQLKNACGERVESDMRAETLATHFESVQ
jgi:hypothetical protein